MSDPRIQSFEILSSWVEAILTEASDKLTEWETIFVTDMKVRVDNKWPVSERQQEILEKIYAEKTD